MKRGKKYLEAAKSIDRATLYDPAEAIGLAKTYRKEGRCIQMLRKASAKSVEEYLEYAKRADVEELIYLEAVNKVETYTIKGNK